MVLAEQTTSWQPSPGQETIWLYEQRYQEVSPYLVAAAFRLIGPLRLDDLRMAVRSVYARHAVLGSTIALDESGRLRQVVRVPLGQVADLPVVDLAHAPQSAEPWLVNSLRTRMDLAAGPVIRQAVVALGAGEWLFGVQAHHAVVDGESLGILLRQIAAEYEVTVGGMAEPHRPAAAFGDVVPWSLSRPQEQAAARAADHWRDVLRDLPDPVPNRHDAIAGPGRRAVTGQVTGSLRPELVLSARQLARQARTTMTCVLLAIYGIVLARSSGTSDLLVGMPFSGRSEAEDDDVVGMFANTLPVRVSCPGDRTLLDVVRAVHDQVVAAMAHERLPAEIALAGDAVLRARLSGYLSEASFQFGSPLAGAFSLRDITVQAVTVPETAVRDDVRIDITPDKAGGLGITCVYDAGVVGDAAADRLLQRFITCAEAIRAPATKVSAITAMPAGERALILELAGPAMTGSACAAASPFTMFHARAERDSSAAALGGQASVSYGRLAELVDQAAGGLARAGVARPPDEPGRPAAIAGDRSPGMVAAVLACLRERIPFLVINPRDPAAHIRGLLASAGASVLIGPAGAPEKLAVDGDIELVPPGIAFLAHTSGSTGAPKQVLIPADGLAPYLGYLADISGLGPDHSVLQLAPPGFDSMIRDLLAALTTGARLVLPPGGAADPASMCDIIREHEVTAVTTLIPSMLRRLRVTIEDSPSARPGSLRFVLCVGERLARMDAEWLLAEFPALNLFNTYGPTECTFTSTFKRISRENLDIVEKSVGRPIPGTDVYVLDDSLALVPLGSTGQICICGPGLSPGYHGMPAQTARSFRGVSGLRPRDTRVFLTGDLGRLRPDGEIGLDGRIDRQVKLGGVRIEPAEVEACLMSRADIAAAFVRKESRAHPSRDRLVAYLERRRSGDIDLAAARQAVADSKPAAYVPHGFVVLDRLPRTPNGKVDAAALPESAEIDTARRPFVPARGGAEAALAELYRDLLGLVDVGRDDDFFLLGGYSLLAMDVVAAVRQRLRRHLTVQDVFEAPAIRDLALRLTPLPVPQAVPAALRLRLASNQEHRLARYLTPGHPPRPVEQRNLQAAYRIRGELPVDVVHNCLDAAVIRHEGLRARFGVEDGRYRQAIAPPEQSRAELTLIGGSGEHPQADQDAILAECRRSFDLASDNLFRGALVSHAADDHTLLLVTEHLVADGQAADLLFGEFWADMRRSLGGMVPICAEPAFTYRHWLDREASVIARDAPGSAAYWDRELAGSLPFPPSPFPPPPPPPPNASPAAPWSSRIDEVRWASLQALAARLALTPFVVCLAALGTAVGQVTGQDDITIHLPYANREDADELGVIGWLSTILPIRLRLKADDDFADRCQSAAAAMMRARSHARLPFPELLRRMQPEHHCAPTPFRIMFGFHYGSAVEAPRIPGLQVEPADLPVDAAGWGDPGLAIQVYSERDGARCTGLYDPARLAASCFEQVTARFLGVLLEVAEERGAR